MKPTLDVPASQFPITPNADGYIIREPSARFNNERIAEHVLRLAGSGSILFGYFHWFLPDLVHLGEGMQIRWLLTLAFVGTGLALYIFGARGFRKEVFIDTFQRRITVANVNSRQAGIIRFSFPMSDIESLFVRRGEGTAALMMRVKGKDRPHILLRGDSNALDSLHRKFCRDIRDSLQATKPKRVQSEQPIACSRTAPWPGRRYLMAYGRGRDTNRQDHRFPSTG